MSFVEDNGHWYLSVSGIVLKGNETLEQYLRMDEFVENGAYFRVYANSNGASYMYSQVSISSAVVPPIGTDDEESELTDDEKSLNEFLDYFTDNIDALRKANMEVVNKVAEMWKALSYINQSNVEAYFLEDDDVYSLVQAIKTYANFEGTPDQVEWITTYTTIYNTITDDDDSPVRKKKVIKKKVAKNGGFDLPIVLIVVVSVVAVVVISGGIVFFVIRKKRKNIKAISE